MKAVPLIILLTFISGIASAAPGQIHYVGPLQAKIYESASAKSKVKFIVAIGRKLVEFGRKNGFINVGIDKSGGRDGWIRASDVSPTDPDGLTY